MRILTKSNSNKMWFNLQKFSLKKLVSQFVLPGHQYPLYRGLFLVLVTLEYAPQLVKSMILQDLTMFQWMTSLSDSVISTLCYKFQEISGTFTTTVYTKQIRHTEDACTTFAATIVIAMLRMLLTISAIKAKLTTQWLTCGGCAALRVRMWVGHMLHGTILASQ